MKVHFLVSSLIIMLMSAACKQPMKINTRSVSKFKTADFGELPLLSGGEVAEVDKLIPMISDDGEFSEGVLNKNTAVTVGTENGKDKTCLLPKGMKISLSVFLQTKNNQQLIVINLSTPCKVAGSGGGTSGSTGGDELVEGYVPLRDIEITINLGNLEVNGATPGTTEPTSSPTAMPTPEVTPTPTPATTPAVALVGCTSVKQGSEEDLASKLDGCTSGSTKCALPGKKFRAADTGVSLAIGGSANKWKFTVKPSTTDPVGKNTPITPVEPIEILNSTLTKVSDAVVLVPLNKIMGVNNWERRDAIVEIQGLDDKGVAVGTQCIHTIAIVSPIALDLSGLNNKKTLEPTASKIKFDHNNDGTKERSGWILPHMGLLVLDSNKNGQVDGGHELFGEYTNGKGKKTFANGYKALAQLDTNKSGYIDAKDKQFADLKVWVDKNSDAVTQSDELKTLTDLEITKIDTTYKPVKDTSKKFANKILFESKFFGPGQCGKSGCMSYDIYFGTSTTVVKK